MMAHCACINSPRAIDLQSAGLTHNPALSATPSHKTSTTAVGVLVMRGVLVVLVVLVAVVVVVLVVMVVMVVMVLDDVVTAKHSAEHMCGQLISAIGPIRG
jgi:hypothetical protein